MVAILDFSFYSGYLLYSTSNLFWISSYMYLCLISTHELFLYTAIIFGDFIKYACGFFLISGISRWIFILGSCLEINNHCYWIIQLPLKWYITRKDQTINTDLVDYIPTIPPYIRRAIYAKCHVGGTYEKRVLTWSSSLLAFFFGSSRLYWTKIYQWVRFWGGGGGCTVGISSPRTNKSLPDPMNQLFSLLHESHNHITRQYITYTLIISKTRTISATQRVRRSGIHWHPICIYAHVYHSKLLSLVGFSARFKWAVLATYED